MENKGVEDLQKAIEKIKSGSPETAINFIKRYINGHSCEIYHQEKMQEVLDSNKWMIDHIKDTLRKVKFIYRENKEETAFDRHLKRSESYLEELSKLKENIK